jgi:hypothetical protein
MDQRTIPSLEKSGSTTGRYGSGSSTEPESGTDGAASDATAATATSDPVASPAA